MRRLSLLTIATCLALTACGEKSSFDDSERFIGDQMAAPQFMPGGGIERHLILSDDKGHKLQIDCTRRGLDVFFLGDPSTSFMTEVIWEVDNQAAYQKFRTDLEFEPGDNDYWSYDDEAGGYEVSFEPSFMAMLAESSLLTIQIAPDDGQGEIAEIFITEEERAEISACVRENEDRVILELKANGLIQ